MVDDETRTEDEGVQSFSVSLSLDRERFFRRECNNCGLEFKTRAHEADIGWFLNNLIERNVENVVRSQEEVGPQHFLVCPYCEVKAKSSSFLTGESMNYLKRFAHREILMPMIERSFADMAKGFDGGSGFLKVTMTHSKSIRPPRAIHGPDAPDMVVVELLCCGEEVKIMEGWLDMVQCPFCQRAIKI